VSATLHGCELGHLGYGYNNSLQPFSPLVRNPHVLTIAASVWPRYLDERRFPVEAKLYRTEAEVQVLVHTQRPAEARGEVVLVHGLEGSSDAGYMRSMAQAALEARFVTHRLNLRNCGGTEFLCPTMYHAGLTSDLFAILMELDRQRRTPVFLIGYSLGGNVVLKLAGEMGISAQRVIAGICAVSAPIDLMASVRCLGKPSNRLYEWHFVRRMKRRLRLKHRLFPERFPIDGLDQVSTVFDLDDRFTAPHFSFRGAAHYYETQSSGRFLGAIRVPTLVIQAKDDPMIPFAIFDHPAFSTNPNLSLVATDHGGHLGFLSRWLPRFWLDAAIVSWMSAILSPKNTVRPAGEAFS
jgi:predicted alpha/beta-fold hydrolase